MSLIMKNAPACIKSMSKMYKKGSFIYIYIYISRKFKLKSLFF